MEIAEGEGEGDGGAGGGFAVGEGDVVEAGGGVGGEGLDGEGDVGGEDLFDGVLKPEGEFLGEGVESLVEAGGAGKKIGGSEDAAVREGDAGGDAEALGETGVVGA